MERRIDGPDRHGTSVHPLEHAVEVTALQRQQLVEGFSALSFGIRENHPLHDRNPSLAEEHVLGPAQSDPASTKGIGKLCLVGLISVGVDTEAAILVSPREELVESPVDC